MRVTNNMMVNSLIYNLQKNLTRMNTDQMHLATGKRIQYASDDPVGTSKILKYKTDINELAQFDVNVRDSLNWLQVTESSIDDTGNALQRARELAVKAANEILQKEDRSKIAEEIRNIKEHLISNGNFSFAGKYVFSGNQTDRPLFKEDGTYNIDVTDGDYVAPVRNKLLIGAAEILEISTNGVDLYGIVDEPNAFDTIFTNTAGDSIGANKSAIKGIFDLDADYTSDSLDVTVGAQIFSVDVTGLNGTEGTLDRDVIVDRLRNGLLGGVGPNKLLDVAEVYFDAHNNLVIEAKAPGVTAVTIASTQFNPMSLFSGDVATKSVLKGSIALSGPTANYSVENLDVTVGGVNYVVDEATLNGFSFKLTKEMLLKQLREAPANGVGPAILSDVADIYFNESDELVIKEKNFGNLPITMPGAPIAGFSSTLTLGTTTQEAVLNFSNFTFDDAFIAANEAELKSTPLYITYDGKRKGIMIDPNAILTSVAEYQTALQVAVDKEFSSGKIAITAMGVAPSQYLQVSTTGTIAGIKPELKLETIRSKQSALIEDFNKFYTALIDGDSNGIQTFLGNIDGHLNKALSVRAEIGAKVNRLELITNRISANTLSFTEMLSDTEDVDMAETVMQLKNAEAVYRASLSTGARVIQPTLIDFLR